MPVRTKEQAEATELLVDQLDGLLFSMWAAVPAASPASVRHPEMLEEIHWDLMQIRGRLRQAITGEYDAV